MAHYSLHVIPSLCSGWRLNPSLPVILRNEVTKNLSCIEILRYAQDDTTVNYFMFPVVIGKNYFLHVMGRKIRITAYISSLPNSIQKISTHLQG